MDLNKLNGTILHIYEEMNTLAVNSKPANNDELLVELVSCILGSQVSYEVANLATDRLFEAGLLNSNVIDRFSRQKLEVQICELLSTPLALPTNPAKMIRYRFAKSRANYVSDAVWAIHSKEYSVKPIRSSSPQDERRKLVSKVKGVGPKQASLFLRNIGHGENLAILDSHILHFMSLFGLLDQPMVGIPNLSRYEFIETSLCNYASRQRLRLSQLDYAIWVVMRTAQRMKYL